MILTAAGFNLLQVHLLNKSHQRMHFSSKRILSFLLIFKYKNKNVNKIFKIEIEFFKNNFEFFRLLLYHLRG